MNMPESIGKYSVLREIGSGGSARVLLAQDAFTERTVAVKLFQGSGKKDGALTGPQRAVFLNEAKLVGRLRHPHIVDLLDAVAEPGQSYIVMDYVPGGTLARYTSVDQLLPFERVIEVAFKISQALEYAHRQGVIHRDIKPSNILLTEALDVKLSDFGIAIVKDATHTHLMNAGTPAYLAPEHLSNEPPTQQSDMYSLGVLMYQLLTGRLPFAASSHASLMYQILNHEPPRPQTLRNELPATIEDIVMRALQKQPDARYASWAELGRELGTLAQVLEPTRESVSEARRFQGLRALSFFQDFSDVEVWEALRIAKWLSFPALAPIIGEGERGDSFYLLVDGQVEVSRAGRHLATLARGDCFGEMLYFSANTTVRNTSIRTRTPVTVAEIKAAALSAASDRCQVQFNKAFMRILMRRLMDANSRLAER